MAPWITGVASAASLIALTAAMVAFRDRLDKAHVALVLLMVVLIVSASGGRRLGLAMAGSSFLVFNWFFLPPYGTLIITDPLDWLVLAAFLVTSIVATQLLARAQDRAALARARADEVDRLATLGAETLGVGRAEEALVAIAGVIRTMTGVRSCELYRRLDDGQLVACARPDEPFDAATTGSLVRWVADSGSAAAERGDGTVRLGASRPGATDVAALAGGAVTALLLPLRVRERTVGVLRIADPAGVRLDPQRWRFVEALSYYAALGVERVRLAGEAEHTEALRAADRLKDALLASVSHDLRTPLTTIKALAHDLAILGDERTEIIEQEADRLNRFVADLLDLSRLNAGALPLRPEINAVDELLGAVVQRVEQAIGEGRLTVGLPAGELLLVGRFDLVHTIRIVTNLVENAARHATGPIELSAHRSGADLVIEVADRGTGIASEERERIFDAFYQGDRRRGDGRGAGLGLSISRTLAEAQGGRLTYAPRSGGGSVFTLVLPAVELDDLAAQLSAPSL